LDLETEVARIERDDLAVPETLGMTLDEGKELTAATQAENVRAHVSMVRALWRETAEQGVLPRYIPPGVRRRGRPDAAPACLRFLCGSGGAAVVQGAGAVGPWGIQRGVGTVVIDEPVRRGAGFDDLDSGILATVVDGLGSRHTAESTAATIGTLVREGD
jgi:hypothetical protein